MNARWLGLMLVLSSAVLLGQNGAVRNNYGSRSGFGNVVFPGTGHAPGVPSSPFSISDPGFAGRLAATVSGSPAYTGAPSGGGRARAVYGYYGVPAYGYGYTYGGYAQPAAQPQVIYAPQPAAPVIINQYFGNAAPQPRNGAADLTPREAPRKTPVEPAAETRSFLIAFKDHAIYSAMAYWVEGETLHYVTPQGAHNQASLDLIDREFTDKLNRERNVEFKLSAQK